MVFLSILILSTSAILVWLIWREHRDEVLGERQLNRILSHLTSRLDHPRLVKSVNRRVWEFDFYEFDPMHNDDYFDPFNRRATITFAGVVIASCAWFLLAAGIYRLLGGML